MLGLYSVYTEQTCWASPLPPTPSHISRSGSAHSLTPGSCETPGFDCHLLSHRGRSWIVGGGMDTMLCVPGLSRYHPLPAPVPKAQLKSCVKELQLAQSWKSRKTSKEECGRILLPPLRHPEPPAGVVSAFLFPESAKPAEAAKWETWGTLN